MNTDLDAAFAANEEDVHGRGTRVVQATERIQTHQVDLQRRDERAARKQFRSAQAAPDQQTENVEDVHASQPAAHWPQPYPQAVAALATAQTYPRNLPVPSQPATPAPAQFYGDDQSVSQSPLTNFPSVSYAPCSFPGFGQTAMQSSRYEFQSGHQFNQHVQAEQGEVDDDPHANEPDPVLDEAQTSELFDVSSYAGNAAFATIPVTVPPRKLVRRLPPRSTQLSPVPSVTPIGPTRPLVRRLPQAIHRDALSGMPVTSFTGNGAPLPTSNQQASSTSRAGVENQPIQASVTTDASNKRTLHDSTEAPSVNTPSINVPSVDEPGKEKPDKKKKKTRSIREVEADRKEVVELAYVIVRALVATVDAFPPDKERSGQWNDAMAMKAWVTACQERGEDFSPTREELTLIKQRISGMRGKLKHLAVGLVEGNFGLISVANAVKETASMEHNRALVEKLTDSRAFTYLDPSNTALKGSMMNNKLIQRLLNTFFYAGRLAESLQRRDYYEVDGGIPMPLVALIVTTIQCALEGWSTGIQRNTTMKGDDHSAAYALHLKGLRDWEKWCAGKPVNTAQKWRETALIAARTFAGVETTATTPDEPVGGMTDADFAANE